MAPSCTGGFELMSGYRDRCRLDNKQEIHPGGGTPQSILDNDGGGVPTYLSCLSDFNPVWSLVSVHSFSESFCPLSYHYFHDFAR